MTQPGGQRRGDQVFTGADSFDFGTSRADMERMMRARTPIVVASPTPDQQPFLATERGRQWLAGAVVAAYWSAPMAAHLKRKFARAKARKAARDANDNNQ